ncbi:MAG: cache domain-containing protein, partial [Microcystaceae cyanobacterium]
MTKFSFRQILPLSFGLNILLVVGVITLLTRWQGQKVMQEIAQQWQGEMGRHIETHLRSYLNQAETLNHSQRSLLANELVSARDLTKIETFLTQQLQANPNLFYTAWANVQGDYIGVSHAPKQTLKVETAGKATNWQYRTYALEEKGKQRRLIRTFPVYDPRTRPWYQTAVQKRKLGWSSVYVWFDGSQLALDAVLPIYDQKGELLGVADTPLPLQQISSFLSQVSNNYSVKSFISDRSGQLIASSIQEPLFTANQGKFKRIKAAESNAPLIRKVSSSWQQNLNGSNKSGNISTFILFENGQRKFVQVIPFKHGENIDWLIFLIVPESNFIGPFQTANNITLITSVIALSVAVFVSMA